MSLRISTWRSAWPRVLRVLQAAEPDRRVRLLHRPDTEAGGPEVGELAVILEQVVRPRADHDVEGFADLLVPTGEHVGGADGGELLDHPARSDADVQPAARELVDRGAVGGHDGRRPVREVEDAHPDADLRGLGGEPRDERRALVEPASGVDRDLVRETFHHPEGVGQLSAVVGLRHDDAVDGPHRVEVEFLREKGEILQLLRGHFVAQVRQEKCQLHSGLPIASVSRHRLAGPQRATTEKGPQQSVPQ